ncbi:MAG: hypothetical protein IK088_01565, partial [Lachnospiraceae bacterium]|nr:hypothetical protein [Lachnospiraceae bacterium]
SLDVNRFGNRISALRYEIRSLDGTSYVDGGTVRNFDEIDDDAHAEILLSNLLKSGTEYHLILVVETETRPVWFYTRILFANTMYASELLSFAEQFSEATVNIEKSLFLVNYIQPRDDSPTNDFAYTDIHSKYAVFTYAGMNVERANDVKVRITEFEPTQMSVTISYTLRILRSNRWAEAEVKEFFVVRYRSGKVYLLDYYRTVEEKFAPDESTSEKGRIVLGIGDGSTDVLTSSDSTYTVFTKNRELWCYNAKTNAMNMIFSFRDSNDLSGRSGYDHHEIQAVKVTNNGSVDYMVYGYMNRGSYEGQVGICFYRYDAEENAATRLFYMPVNQSELVLMMDLGTLAYVNDNDVCYLRYGDGIYSIDLNSGESVEVSIRAYPGMYAKNERGNVVAWAEGSDLTYPERLVILNMDSQTTLVVDAEAGSYVKILNFIGNDIIYGFGNQSDSVVSANIDVNQLLNRIVIASTDEKLTVHESYRADGFLILSVRVYETRLTIQRAKKLEDGSLDELGDDVLLITQNIRGDAERSMVMSRIQEKTKKEYYIQISKATNVDSQFSTLTPRFEVLKQANVIRLLHQQNNVYYVYGYGRLIAVESELNKAIREAYDVFGVVVDENMNTLWTRGTRDLFKTISIQPLKSSGSESPLATSIRILIAQEGIQARNTESKLGAGESPLKILDDAIGDGRSINLYGCSLQEVLYFVNESHPVMAITGNREAVVITGYDLDNVMIYDPVTGETGKQSMNEAAAYFEGLNHLFVSYK